MPGGVVLGAIAVGAAAPKPSECTAGFVFGLGLYLWGLTVSVLLARI